MAKGIPSLVWITMDLRSGGLLPVYIPVSFADDGAYYILDTSKMVNNECPVLIWDDGNQATEKAYDNFGTFLLAMISDI